MNPVGGALAFSAFSTFVIAAVELINQSKVHIKFCFTWESVLYVILLLIGNTCTTLVAVSIINATLDPTLYPAYIWFWYSFLGVFGFEAIIQKINITFFDKGVLSINDWLTKARNTAVAAIIRNAAYTDVHTKQRLALTLVQQIPEPHIHTHALNIFGAQVYSQLIANAKASRHINIPFYLALALANEKPEETKAIVSTANDKALK